jgi:hypothetical protein
MYLKGKGVYLADDGGIVNIGNSAGSITINSPLTINYTSNYNPATLGYNYNYIAAYRLSFPNSTTAVYGSTPLLPSGVYAISGALSFGGSPAGTTGYISIATSSSTLSEGATSGFSLVDYHFSNNATWNGPGGGGANVFSRDIYAISSPACLGLAVGINSVSNAGQGYARFTIVRIA